MLKVQCHISLEENGSIFLDAPKISLLNEIYKLKSLSAAAKQLKISYQHAWNMISEMNNLAPKTLVEKHRGGANGGGAFLTDYGKRVLTEYKLIETHIQVFVNKINIEINI